MCHFRNDSPNLKKRDVRTTFVPLNGIDMLSESTISHYLHKHKIDLTDMSPTLVARLPFNSR